MLRSVCVREEGRGREREREGEGERERGREGEKERRVGWMGSEMMLYYVLCAHLVPYYQ